MDFEKRKTKLVRNLAKKGSNVDCVMITSLPNLTYYFNYAGASYERFCAGLISMKEGKSSLVVPKLDEGKTTKSVVDGVFPWTDSEGYGQALEKALASIGGRSRNVGCEDWTTLYSMESVKKVRTGAKFQSISPSISDQRLIKDEEEIQALRLASGILSKGYEKLPEILKAGKSEIEAGFEMKKTLTDLGASEVGFLAIQSGPNSSVPHSQTSQKKLSDGDMVVVDIGCTSESGYNADFTRTFCVGRPSEEQRKVYGVVQEAQSTGVKSAVPNKPAKNVDRDVRKIIQDAGFGEFFVHRTGHGLGLEVHEPPWISSLNPSKIKPGMAFTVEPGIYIPGKFGVRIEDNVVANSSGNENLTQVTHELIEV